MTLELLDSSSILKSGLLQARSCIWRWVVNLFSLLSLTNLCFVLFKPERILGEEYTIRSEVWSTGISMLELVQNRFPFPDLPPIELILHITRGEVRLKKFPC